MNIDTVGKNYFINAQLRKSNNIDLNKKLEKFYSFVKELENLFTKITKKNIKSLIRDSDTYDPIINLKIIKQKNIITEITKNNEFFNFFNIQKKLLYDL